MGELDVDAARRCAVRRPGRRSWWAGIAGVYVVLAALFGVCTLHDADKADEVIRVDAKAFAGMVARPSSRLPIRARR